MKLTFLGTRGYIDSCSPEHRQHSSLLLSYRGVRVVIDCGEDWLGKLGPISPHAIFVTHAHPDHASGLKDGANCPVYATMEVWSALANFPIAERRTFRFRPIFAASFSPLIGGRGRLVAINNQ